MAEQANRLTGVHVTPTVLFNVRQINTNDAVLAKFSRELSRAASHRVSARAIGRHGWRKMSSEAEDSI